MPNRMLRWRRWLKPFLVKNNTPEAIAGGIAIGFVVAFTPTIGFQLIAAYLIATYLHASRTAALLPVWITTPVTATPIYAFTYMVGNWFVRGPSVHEVRTQLARVVSRIDEYDALDLRSRLQNAMSIGSDLIIPMWIGGLLVGGVCASLAYPLTLYAVRRLREHRAQKRHQRRLRDRLKLPLRRSRPRHQ